MSFQKLCGAAAIGFAVLLLSINAILVPSGFPLPGSPLSDAELADFFATHSGVLRFASTLTVFGWLLGSVFAVGAFAALWPGERARGSAWSVLGLAGVLMQNVTFTALEALRLGLISGARHDAVPVLWGFYTALFGFNQLFLAMALLGLSLAGLCTGFIARWHGGLGLVAAALLFVSACAAPFMLTGAKPFALCGGVGWSMWVGWIAVYGVALIRHGANRFDGRAVALG
ncbi:hypothetical protein [Nocardia sp. NPDC051570]|uniref:hypothetical protein n=1 Tax=Nocardia sp. NPDC051570 TaxID=3364324 RepID=UPI0037B272F3